MKVDLLYRGPLESCNYGCHYCPFAKKEDGPEALAADRAALDRFVGWVEAQSDLEIGVLFTPWGEALVRPWYREALVRLTQLPHVRRAAVQTNLSVPIDFTEDAVAAKLGIWATYHPEWTDLDRFARRITQLHARGVQVSAGIVGFSSFAAEVQRLRRAIPEAVYVWINAPKSYETFDEETVTRLETVDPLFGYNTRYHESLGETCHTGRDVVAVYGDGSVRRCHFVEEVIGNLYETPLSALLRPTPCPASRCGCHIGYVHLEKLKLRPVFGDGILERVPARSAWRKR